VTDARPTPRLRAAATHLYPGARLRGDAPLAPGPTLVAFADGVEAPGEIEADGATLSVAAHRTARGARIPAKRWRLAETPEGWRVAARA
jgi:hypothetical protein